MTEPTTLALERPRSVDEALALLSVSAGPRILAGGQSLVPLLKLGFAAPEVVISLDRCEDLDGITAEGAALRLGAMVTTRRVEVDGAVASGSPLLAEAAARVGSPHVRNFGTLVGNLCHADPGSDLIPAALCLGAELEVRSTRGDRWVTIAELIEGPFTTSLEADEIATAVRVPFLDESWRHGYRKLTLRAGDLAVATAAVLLCTQGNTIVGARLVVGGALRRATRIARVEEALAGTDAATASHVALGVDWITDIAGELLPDGALSLDYLEGMLPRFLAATVRDAASKQRRGDR